MLAHVFDVLFAPGADPDEATEHLAGIAQSGHLQTIADHAHALPPGTTEVPPDLVLGGAYECPGCGDKCMDCGGGQCRCLGCQSSYTNDAMRPWPAGG
ncbi:hypothetical protein FRUB_10279 [Fimbriiglobus ruber]|uniref:Uncharacterized protein n=1 Tax=Fimbriiglobus ruber TaxID=1908690 RepID=A0A225D6Y7_9BACT|nr:hypothetical protein FRUB_10279 [Fimbriiglobus ruber]